MSQEQVVAIAGDTRLYHPLCAEAVYGMWEVYEAKQMQQQAEDYQRITREPETLTRAPKDHGGCALQVIRDEEWDAYKSQVEACGEGDYDTLCGLCNKEVSRDDPIYQRRSENVG